MSNLKVLVSNYSLSDFDQKLLNNICSSYIMGDMEEFEKVLDYSKIGKKKKGVQEDPNKSTPQKALKKILQSFHYSYFHKLDSINWQTFDIFNKTSLSPNEYKNKRLMYLLLW